MRLNLKQKSKLLILLLGLFSSSLPAVLPKLITKQSIYNLRFIEKDGTFTYFQNRSGNLYQSKNYKIIQLMKGGQETFYTFHSTHNRKKMVLEVDGEYSSSNQLMRNNVIYSLDFGGTSIKKIGDGIFPRLHLNDTWVSFYNTKNKSLVFTSLNKEGVIFTIKLLNPLNQYFIPETLMKNEKEVYFTDLNSLGNSALILFNRSSQNFTTLYKTRAPGLKIELCKGKKDLYIGLFSLPDIQLGTEIIKINYSDIKNIANVINFDKYKTLYKSEKADIGNILCSDDDQYIYFIQNTGSTSKYGLINSEAVSLDLNNNKLTVLSNLRYVDQIINVDGKILIPFRGDFYILSGSANYQEESLQAIDSSDNPENSDNKAKKDQ